MEEVCTPRLHWKEGRNVEGDKEIPDLCDYSTSPPCHLGAHTQHSQLGGNFCHEPEDMVNSPSSPDDTPVCNLPDSTQTILKKVFEDLVSHHVCVWVILPLHVQLLDICIPTIHAFDLAQTFPLPPPSPLPTHPLTPHTLTLSSPQPSTRILRR